MAVVEVLDQFVDVESGCSIYNGDCVEVIKGIPDEGLALRFSPLRSRVFTLTATRIGTWGTVGRMTSSLRISDF